MATSRSATVLAARRAVETLHSEGLVKDQYARFFADQEAMKIAKEGDGEVHYVLMRHRSLEDFFLKHLDSVSQVVMLGAGFDTKFQRHVAGTPRERNLTFIEVDGAAVLKVNWPPSDTELRAAQPNSLGPPIHRNRSAEWTKAVACFQLSTRAGKRTFLT